MNMKRAIHHHHHHYHMRRISPAGLKRLEYAELQFQLHEDVSTVKRDRGNHGVGYKSKHGRNPNVHALADIPGYSLAILGECLALSINAYQLVAQ